MKTLTLKRLFVPSLALSGLVASVMFAAKPAEAASLTYDWSFSGLNNTGGTFVADDVTGLLSSIAGTVNGSQITGLLDVGDYWGNDNKVPIVDGVAFSANGINWMFSNGEGEFLLFNGDNGTHEYFFGLFNYGEVAKSSAPAAVPEPLTILGSITAAGFGVAFKRKKNSNKEE